MYINSPHTVSDTHQVVYVVSNPSCTNLAKHKNLLYNICVKNERRHSRMNEYDEYDYCDDIPHVGACPRRKPSHYDLDTMTPAENMVGF